MPGANQNEANTSEDEQETESLFEEESESEAVESTSEERPESGDVERNATREEVVSDSADSTSEGEAEQSAAAGDEETTAAESTPPSAGGSEKGVDEVFCASCGEPIKKQAEVCPHCGVPQDTASTGDSEKSPGIAAVASFFFPGLGDIYNGEFGRGAVIFVGWLVGAFIWTIVIGVIGAITLGIGLLAAPLYAVVNFVSAYLSYKRAEKINDGEIRI